MEIPMDVQITAAINKQINMELYSAYLYLEFANYYAEINLDGFEHWFFVQAQEELDHAQLFTKYLHNNEEKVTLETIHAPVSELSSPIMPLKLALQHEKQVTKKINEIYEIALSKKDFRSTQLLDWFIQEQGEEEKTASELIAKMELFGSDPKALYLLNNEFMTRVYSAPSLVL